MGPPNGTLASSRLRRIARRPPDRPAAALDSCDLCGEPIGPEHRHLLDLSSGELRCACRSCTILFDRPAAGGGHYRLVPDRRLAIPDLALDDATWESLRIPVDMAFFFRSSPAGRVLAFYPGPMGATESLLELRAWQELEAANPVLRTLEPDVEALLVNRARGARQHFLVPIEDPYDLAGLIRSRWRGLTGGREVWEEIDAFFDALARRSKEVGRYGQARPPLAPAGGGGEETA
jgi:hypothetical protein